MLVRRIHWKIVILITLLSRFANYTDGKEAEPPSPDTTLQEAFSWSSVILPFLFLALGGLLFGYDIGATYAATISMQDKLLYKESFPVVLCDSSTRVNLTFRMKRSGFLKNVLKRK